MSRVRGYLLDILDYTDKIADFTREGRAVFFADEKTQLAVIQAYEVIGEIVKRLPNSLLEQQPQIAWKKVKGFRDFLAHNYDEVILRNVWGTVEALPALRAAIEALLQSVEEDSDQDG